MPVYKTQPILNGEGGKDYTAGNGIEITEENVINNTQDAVIANPELAGDEPDLTGLEVGNTKYKVPQGGKVYTVFDFVQLNGKKLNIDKFKTFLTASGVDLTMTSDGLGFYVQLGQVDDSAYGKYYIFYLTGYDISGQDVEYTLKLFGNDNISSGYYSGLNDSLGEVLDRFKQTVGVDLTFSIGYDYINAPTDNLVMPAFIYIAQAIESGDNVNTYVYDINWQDFFNCFDDVNNG